MAQPKVVIEMSHAVFERLGAPDVIIMSEYLEAYTRVSEKEFGSRPTMRKLFSSQVYREVVALAEAKRALAHKHEQPQEKNGGVAVFRSMFGHHHQGHSH